MEGLDWKVSLTALSVLASFIFFHGFTTEAKISLLAIAVWR